MSENWRGDYFYSHCRRHLPIWQPVPVALLLLLLRGDARSAKRLSAGKQRCSDLRTVESARMPRFPFASAVLCVDRSADWRHSSVRHFKRIVKWHCSETDTDTVSSRAAGASILIYRWRQMRHGQFGEEWTKSYFRYLLYIVFLSFSKKKITAWFVTRGFPRSSSCIQYLAIQYTLLWRWTERVLEKERLGEERVTFNSIFSIKSATPLVQTFFDHLIAGKGSLYFADE